MPPVGHYWRIGGRDDVQILQDLQTCGNLGAHLLDERRVFMLIRSSSECCGACLVGAVEMKGEDATIQMALGP